MKSIDNKNEVVQYLKAIRSYDWSWGSKFSELPETIRQIIKAEEVVKIYHCTHGVIKELFHDCLLGIEPRFQFDSNCEPLINNLVSYLRKDPGFLSLDQNYSFSKGIMLHGFVGCGKTLIMKGFVNLFNAFIVNTHSNELPYKTLPSYEISHAFSQNGYKIFETGITKQSIYNGTIGLSNGRLFIDDIGSEPIVSHYGNVVNIVGELILIRYDGRETTTGTTNLDVKNLKSLYGDRVFSRMKEMFNFMYLEGKDKRK